MGDNMVAEMLEGLRAFEQRTRGQSPLLRAAALSFGYLHEGQRQAAQDVSS